MIKISKEYNWEMGHRLPNHNGLCRNIHGHSYRMFVELEGDVGKNGMIIDFKDLSLLVMPIIEELDHSFLCFAEDKDVINFLRQHNLKYKIVSYNPTVENICMDLFQKIKEKIIEKNIKNIKHLTIRIHESPNDYAEFCGEL